jgi:hypothetical protein
MNDSQTGRAVLPDDLSIHVGRDGLRIQSGDAAPRGVMGPQPGPVERYAPTVVTATGAVVALGGAFAVGGNHMMKTQKQRENLTLGVIAASAGLIVLAVGGKIVGALAAKLRQRREGREEKVA